MWCEKVAHEVDIAKTIVSEFLFGSSPLHPYWHWCPPTLLSSGYQEFFPWR
jgi:hypothetical protein